MSENRFAVLYLNLEKMLVGRLLSRTVFGSEHVVSASMIVFAGDLLEDESSMVAYRLIPDEDGEADAAFESVRLFSTKDPNAPKRIATITAHGFMLLLQQNLIMRMRYVELLIDEANYTDEDVQNLDSRCYSVSNILDS